MKKLLSLVLSLAMVLTMSTTAFAATIQNGSGNVEITCGVSESYTVIIPADITLTEDQESNIAISASDVLIPYGNWLNVSISSTNYDDNKWYLVNTADQENKLEYSMKNGEDAVTSGSTILSVTAGMTDLKTANLSAKLVGTATASGIYTDTLTFQVSVSESNTTMENAPKITAVSFSGEMVSTDAENKIYTITVPAEGGITSPLVTITGTNLKKIVDDKVDPCYFRLVSTEIDFQYESVVNFAYQYNEADGTISASDVFIVGKAHTGTYMLEYSNDNKITWEDSGWKVVVVTGSAEK